MFGVTPRDPVTFVGVPVLLGLVALRPGATRNADRSFDCTALRVTRGTS
jgi:hypothetical protein